MGNKENTKKAKTKKAKAKAKNKNNKGTVINRTQMSVPKLLVMLGALSSAMPTEAESIQPQPIDALFVCTGNTCRSKAAEGIAQMLNKEGKYESSGIRVRKPGTSPASDMRRQLYNEFGVNYLGQKNQYSRQLECNHIFRAKAVYGMNKKSVKEIKKFASQCGNYPGTIATIDDVPVSDPFFCRGKPMKQKCYKHAYQQLGNAVKRQLKKKKKSQKIKTQKPRNFKHKR